MEKSTTYFRGLHALRFFAASFVIFHHIEQYKAWAGRPNNWGSHFVDSLGHASVSFFFVLSGFLITYLLLKEAASRGTIRLRHFYWKRILRIWPVYFLVVGAALSLPYMLPSGLFPDAAFTISPVVLFALVTMFPNLLRIAHPMLVGGNQLWSVGVEEQFYLFWPILIRCFHRNIFGFLVLFLMLKGAGSVFFIWRLREEASLAQLAQLYTLFPVEQMAFGGIGAALIFHKKAHLLNFLRSNVLFIASVLFVAIDFFYGWHILLSTYLEGLFFMIVLINIIHRSSIHRPLENSLLVKLGDRSYGIYMYHTLVIALSMAVLERLPISLNVLQYDLLLYTLAFCGTLGVSHLSWLYLEKPLLRWKEWSWKRPPQVSVS